MAGCFVCKREVFSSVAPGILGFVIGRTSMNALPSTLDRIAVFPLANGLGKRNVLDHLFEHVPEEITMLVKRL
jgi:hypothetical protein